MATTDVKDMFFMVPLQPQDQDRFAFTWKGQQFTFTWLPQGYKHSPTLAHHALAQELELIPSEEGVKVYQYIDDVLIAGSQPERVQTTQENITHLENLGLKILPEKIQTPSNEVKFLGIWRKGGMTRIPQDTLSTLDQIKMPESKKELQHVLGILDGNGVRLSHDLSEGEIKATQKRREKVLMCLEDLEIHCNPNNVPNIAILGSGGGLRAMIALLGTLVGLKKKNILDAVMYLCGVSGSTWCMSLLYEDEKWSENLMSLKEKLCQNLSNSTWDITKAEEYLEESSKDEHYSLTDFWASFVACKVLKQFDENELADHKKASENGINPYPIYAAVNKEKLTENNGQSPGTWFEFTPHEAGYTALGAFVSTKHFGSEFEKGKLKQKKKKKHICYLQGLWGSALGSMEENLKFIKGTIIFLLPVFSNQLSHLLKLSTYFTLPLRNPCSPLVPSRNTAMPNKSSSVTQFVIIRDDKTEIFQILSKTVQLEELKFQLYQRRSALWREVSVDWKKDAIPVFRKSRKEDLGSLRSTSHTSVPGNVIEQILLEDLSEHFINKKPMKTSQRGFMKGKSCLANMKAFYNERTVLVDEQRAADAVYRPLKSNPHAFMACCYQPALLLLDLQICAVSGSDPKEVFEKLLNVLSDKETSASYQLCKAMCNTWAMKTKEERMESCAELGNEIEREFAGSVLDIFNMASKTVRCACRWKWGTTNNFLYKCPNVRCSDLVKNKTISLIDAGLAINSAYPLVLRAQRRTDLIISFDFSSGNPFETIQKTSDYCKANSIPFPSIEVREEDKSNPYDCYIFRGDKSCPTVMHFPLFNNVNCSGNCSMYSMQLCLCIFAFHILNFQCHAFQSPSSLSAAAANGHRRKGTGQALCEIEKYRSNFSTFKMSYSKENIEDLLAKASLNVYNNSGKILQEIERLVSSSHTKEF
ncbi:LOW QUALITY PROTEIN: cytosolic phospholipase A2 gamma-like [Theristicus caerulescens]